MPTRKRRVFVSFDFDNDRVLATFIDGQAKLADSPFEMTNWTLKEVAPGTDWVAKANARIKQVDKVIIRLGRKPET